MNDSQKRIKNLPKKIVRIGRRRKEERKILIYYTGISQTRGSPYGSFGVLNPRS
jgi:hypothetical protein